MHAPDATTIGNAEYFQAVALYQQGRRPETEATLERALAANERHVGALHLLGVLRFQRGAYDAAVMLLGRALAQSSRAAEAAVIHGTMGTALKASGRAAEAIVHFEAAVSLDPSSIEARYNLGNALLALSRFDEAIVRYREVLSGAPDFAEAHNNLGNALLARRRAEEALPHFERMLVLRPGLAEAHYNVGGAFICLGRRDDAAAQFEKAVGLKADFAEAHLTLTQIRGEQERFVEAQQHYDFATGVNPNAVVAYFERQAARSPNSAAAHFVLGAVLEEQGRMEEARERYERALAIDPHHAKARLGLCATCLPVIYDDEAEIDTRRSYYERQLASLEETCRDPEALRELAGAVGTGLPFFLAYQGRNDCELQSRYGAVLCRAMAARYPPAKLASPPAAGEKVRVGIVSGFFSSHSNWKIPLRGWLSQIDRSRFTIFGYHTMGSADAITSVAAGLCDRFVAGPLKIERWREEIQADAPHVLIYPEIGMEPHAAALAAQRLAPVQCNSWGHPQTSGFPTLDYFLSSDLMEPPDGQKNYTERLVRLPNLSIYYDPAEVAPPPLERTEIGLRPSATVFWCGQSLFKYLPQHDEVFVRIATELRDCQFVFLRINKAPRVSAQFERRLEKAFAAVGLKAADHCLFLPNLTFEGFVATMGLCDINLDSIGWSGCNSTLESLLKDLPIVALQAPLMRGRHSAAILEMMGITDTIVDGIDEYIATAVRLARDHEWRAAMRRRIAEAKDRLYRDQAPIVALQDFLDRVARQPRDAAMA